MKHSYLAILIVSALLLSTARSVNAQSPTPTTANHDSQAQNNQRIENGHRPQVPDSFIEALRAITDEREDARKEDQANEKRWWPPSASWAIVYITIGYAFIAFFQLKSIDRQADISERALTRDKVPYVFVKEPHQPNSTSLFQDRRVDIRYTLKNYGNGPAFLRAIIGQTSISEGLGPIPHARPREPLLPVGDILGADEETPLLEAVPSVATLSDSDWRSLEIDPDAKFKVFFYGLINYVDVWGNEWTNGFAWIYDPNIRRMRIATKYEVPEGYNYHRQEQKTEGNRLRHWLRSLIGI